MAVHGKDSTVLLDALALTGYLKGVDVDSGFDLADVTVMGDEGHRFLPGLDTASVSFAGVFDNTAAAGSQDATLEAARQAAAASVVTIAPNGMALGARVTSLSARESSYALSSPVGDAVALSAGWQSDGQTDRGVSLRDLASTGTTANGSSVDNAALSSGGAVGALHVTANTRNGTTIVKIQHSTDDAAWADLITFATVGSTTTTAERATSTGTVNRYLRAIWTIAGATGAVTFAVAVARR